MKSHLESKHPGSLKNNSQISSVRRAGCMKSGNLQNFANLSPKMT